MIYIASIFYMIGSGIIFVDFYFKKQHKIILDLAAVCFLIGCSLCVGVGVVLAQ